MAKQDNRIVLSKQRKLVVDGCLIYVRGKTTRNGPGLTAKHTYSETCFFKKRALNCTTTKKITSQFTAFLYTSPISSF